MRILVLLLALLWSGGCAASYSAPPLAPDDPGNPSAVAPPMPARPGTLDVPKGGPVAPATPAPAMTHTMPGMSATPQPGAPAAQAMPGMTGMSGMSAPVPGGAASTPATGSVVYACVMHPEVTSTDPGARCPKCGMKLQPRPPSGGAP